MSSRSSSSTAGYSLTEIQLKKLCYDIFEGLHPDNKTLSNISNIKDSLYKVIYMNEDQSKVMSVLPSTSKQINQALDKLVKDAYIVKVMKSGVYNYMRNSKSENFENPYADEDDNDGEDDNDEEDENDEDDENDDEGGDNDGEDIADAEGGDEENGDENGITELASSKAVPHIIDGAVVHSEVAGVASTKKRARKPRAPKDPNAPKKVKKKDSNPLKRKINPDLLGALANAGVYVMEGSIVLKEKALDAAERIEKGLWHTSMQPRAQGRQQTIQGAFQKQTPIASTINLNIQGRPEHFNSEG